MQKITVEEKVIEIASNLLGFKKENIAGSDSFVDLGIDSLDLFEISTEIEIYYDIALNNDSVLECRSFNDFIKLVKSIKEKT